MLAARINPILRHIVAEATATALRCGVAIGDVVATLLEVVTRLEPPREAAGEAPDGASESREAWLSSHIQHQLTCQRTVSALYDELFAREGLPRATLREALVTVATEPAAGAAHQAALRTIERLLFAQALVHAVAAWADLHKETAPCVTH